METQELLQLMLASEDDKLLALLVFFIAITVRRWILEMGSWGQGMMERWVTVAEKAVLDGLSVTHKLDLELTE